MINWQGVIWFLIGGLVAIATLFLLSEFALCQTVEQSTSLLSDDQAIQFVEANPEIIDFAAAREPEPLTVSVSAWLDEQPQTYSGILSRIRDRRRPKDQVDKEKKTILDKIHERRIDRKEARTDLQTAKGGKWYALAWCFGAGAVLVLALALAISFIIGSIKG